MCPRAGIRFSGVQKLGHIRFGDVERVSCLLGSQFRFLGQYGYIFPMGEALDDCGQRSHCRLWRFDSFTVVGKHKFGPVFASVFGGAELLHG